MTYPKDQHTAVLARWANFFGLGLSPDGKGVIWSANSSSCNKWEAWNNQTRTYISSGTLSGALTPRGNQPRFPLTNNHYLYQIANDMTGDHLVRHANYGAGSQEDMGALTGLTFTASDGCSKAMLAANGKTYILISSFSFELDGMLFCHDTPSTPPVLLDTSVGTGQDWQIKWGILDGHGDVWALGGRGDLTSSQLAFWRVVNASGISRTDYFVATMPGAQAGTTVNLWGFHSLTGDHFIIVWPNAVGGDFTMTVAYDGTVTNATTSIVTDPYNGPATASNQRPTDTTLWLGHAGANAKQYSCANLSLIQTVQPDLWGYGDSGVIQNGWTWDPENKALFVGLENANENFAWLFFPPLKRKASTSAFVGRIGGGHHGHSPPPPPPQVYPLGVVAAGLEPVWDKKLTAGLKVATTKTLPANEGDLPAGASLGTFGPANANYVRFTADADTSLWDFSGYEVIADGCAVIVRQSRLHYVGGSRLCETMNGGSLHIISSDYDCTGMYTGAGVPHGTSINPPGCAIIWEDLHAWNAPRIYCDNKGAFTLSGGSYIEAFGTNTDPLDHGECIKTDLGSFVCDGSIIDIGDGGRIISGITGLLFWKADSTGDITASLSNSIFNWADIQALLYTFQAGQNSPNQVTISFNTCAIKRGSSGVIAFDPGIIVNFTNCFDLVTGHPL